VTAPRSGRAIVAGVALAALAATGVAARPARGSAHAATGGAPATAPERLADTGLFADVATGRLEPGVLPYVPQYALWTDGAVKRRWIWLPPGASIDASDPDRWQFPPGTRLWKEFSVGGRPIETRYLARAADGTWTYATYLWTADGSDASRAPEQGVRAAASSRPGVPYDVPGTADCRACHEGHPSVVLGFGALQLSPDRDPGALHPGVPEPGAVDLPALVRRGLVQGLPPAVLARPPRIDAPTPRARAALGWLHANCASCHNGDGPLASLGLSLEQRIGAPGGAAAALATAVDVVARLRPGGAETLRLAPGHPERSLVVARAASRVPVLQMPPFGTHLVDEEAVALLSTFVREDLADAPATAYAAREKTP
jgi:hypothetical protein